MSRRLIFSAEGVDWGDDASIEAFACQVWKTAVTELTDDEPEDDEDLSGKDE